MPPPRTRRERKARQKYRRVNSGLLRALLERRATTTRRPSPSIQGGARLGALGGIRTIVLLEATTMRRRPLTRLLLGAWLALVYALLVLVLATAGSGPAGGTLAHSLITTTTLAGLLCVLPHTGADLLTRTRSTGVLDLLRITRFSARTISLGTYVASLTKAIVLIALAAPAMIASTVMGGTDLSGLAGALTVLTSVAITVTAIGHACAARIARRTAAMVAAYALMGSLVLLPPLAYALALPLTSETVPTTVTVATRPESGGAMTCSNTTEDRERTRADRVWWLLTAQPFVMLADASPGRVGGDLVFEPLSATRDAVRDARLSPPDRPTIRECVTAATASGEGTAATQGEERAARQDANALLPHWPIGLALNLALATAALGLAGRALRTPGPYVIGERSTGHAPQDTLAAEPTRRSR